MNTPTLDELRALAHSKKDDAVAMLKDMNMPGIPTMDEMRERAKTVNYGVIYGMGAFGLASRLGLSVAEGRAFIESYFNIQLNHAHIDLRYILQSLGFRGGLKGCERQLGIDRGDLRDIDGFFAVLLWHEYQRNGNRPRVLVAQTLLSGVPGPTQAGLQISRRTSPFAGGVGSLLEDG